VFIPNKDIIQSPLTNFTRTSERRVELRVGVAYTDDLEKVREVATQAVETIACRKKGREVEVHFEEFGDSSINFVLWMWVDYTCERDYVAARSEAVLRIKAAFEKTDITIPYPIRTLDFGLRGGDAIRKALATVEVADSADPRNKWTGSGRAETEGGDPEEHEREREQDKEKDGASVDEKS
jgi:small-conductance mechanosensitive channel